MTDSFRANLVTAGERWQRYNRLPLPLHIQRLLNPFILHRPAQRKHVHTPPPHNPPQRAPAIIKSELLGSASEAAPVSLQQSSCLSSAFSFRGCRGHDLQNLRLQRRPTATGNSGTPPPTPPPPHPPGPFSYFIHSNHTWWCVIIVTKKRCFASSEQTQELPASICHWFQCLNSFVTLAVFQLNWSNSKNGWSGLDSPFIHII